MRGENNFACRKRLQVATCDAGGMFNQPEVVSRRGGIQEAAAVAPICANDAPGPHDRVKYCITASDLCIAIAVVRSDSWGARLLEKGSCFTWPEPRYHHDRTHIWDS